MYIIKDLQGRKLVHVIQSKTGLKYKARDSSV